MGPQSRGQAPASHEQRRLGDIWDSLLPHMKEMLKNEDKSSLLMYNPHTKQYHLPKKPQLFISDEKAAMRMREESRAGTSAHPTRVDKRSMGNVGASMRQELRPHTTEKPRKGTNDLGRDMTKYAQRLAANYTNDRKLDSSENNRIGLKRAKEGMDTQTLDYQHILQMVREPGHGYLHKIGSLPGENGLIFPRVEPRPVDSFLDDFKYVLNPDYERAASNNIMLHANDRTRRENEPLRKDHPLLVQFDQRQELLPTGMSIGERFDQTTQLGGSESSQHRILSQFNQQRMINRELPDAVFPSMGLTGDGLHTNGMVMIHNGANTASETAAAQMNLRRIRDRSMPENIGLNEMGAPMSTSGNPFFLKSAAMSQQEYQALEWAKRKSGLPSFVQDQLNAAGGMGGGLPSTSNTSWTENRAGQVQQMLRAQKFLDDHAAVPDYMEVSNIPSSSYSLPSTKNVAQEVQKRMGEERLLRRGREASQIQTMNMEVANQAQPAMIRQLGKTQLMQIAAERSANLKSHADQLLDAYGNNGVNFGGGSTMVDFNPTKLDPITMNGHAKEREFADHQMLASMSELGGAGMGTSVPAVFAQKNDPFNVHRAAADKMVMLRQGITRVPTSVNGPVSTVFAERTAPIFEKDALRRPESELAMKRNAMPVYEVPDPVVIDPSMTQYTIGQNIDAARFGNLNDGRTFGSRGFMENSANLRVKNPITGRVNLAPSLRATPTKRPPPTTSF